MEVWCGMIMGFDNDDETIFDAPDPVRPGGADRLLDERHALRRSPRRRSTTAWPPRAGSTRPTAANSAPTSSRCRSSREELRDGYIRVMNELYEPEAYFDRTDALFLKPIVRLSGSRSCTTGCTWPRLSTPSSSRFSSRRSGCSSG